MSALVLVTAGCLEPEAPRPTVQRTDSAGVEIVDNLGPDVPLPWELEERFVLGGEEEGPASFYQLFDGAVTTDGEGNLLVVDITASRIVSFDADGGYRSTMGREGDGPGELRLPRAIVVDRDGNAYVFNVGKSALVGFDANGQPLPQVPFPYASAPFSNRHFAPVDVGFVVLGRPNGGVSHDLRWLRDDTETTIASVSYDDELVTYATCGLRVRFPPVFFADIRWDAQGDRVAFAGGPEYSIAVWRNGRVERVIRRAIEPAAATRQAAMTKLGDGMDFSRPGGATCTISPGDLADGRGFADVVPAIESVAFAPGGELWVARTGLGADPSTVLDVFGPEGDYLGTLTGTPMPLAFLGPNRVAVLRTDELDVDRVAVLDVVR